MVRPSRLRPGWRLLDICLAAVGRNQSGDENVGSPRALLQKESLGLSPRCGKSKTTPSQNPGSLSIASIKGRSLGGSIPAGGAARSDTVRPVCLSVAGYSVFGWE